MPAKKKRRITAEDLYRFHLISDCQLSPDGRHVVFAAQRVDRETEKKYSNLWVVSTDGGEPRQFTYGDQNDSQPRWSPDGSEIALLSNRSNADQPQLHLIPFHGGEARPLTDIRGEFGDFSWSPDGKKLVCSFRKKDREAIEREEDEQKKELGIVDRHITTRTFFKLDAYGYLPHERWHLWTIDARTGKGKQLTDGPIHDETSPCWSPDGRTIAFASNRSDEPDLDPDADDLFLISVSGGAPRKIETPLGRKSSPSFSPDGRSIAYLGEKGRGNWWQNQCLWLVPVDGSGKARNLTEKFDFHASDVTLGDLAGFSSSQRPTWSKQGDRIYFQVSRHGSTHLYSIAPSGRRDSLRLDIGEDGAVGSYNFDKDQSRLACIHADRNDPGQVYLRDADSGKTRQLTHFNPWLRDVDLGKVEEVWFEGGDGQVQGWILKPPGFRSSRKYPSILQIHGGPFMQYGKLLMHEFQFLAAQGYVVYFCNPRGSQGYGAQHVKPLWQNWGEPDFVDLMNFADLMVAKPYIDPKRMGVTGGSYGGFMTAWIIGHTHRFAAAVAQRVVSNMISMWGSSDFNWNFQHECGNKPPWENLAEFWRQSPMKHIGSARTPTLVVHSERDLRCAQEQGEQLYVALKKLGVDTELVLFPDEPHGLSRGGRTDRRIARLNHLKRWFDRYLKP